MINRNNPDPENRFGLRGDGGCHAPKEQRTPATPSQIRRSLYFIGTIAAVAGVAFMLSKPTPLAYKTQISKTLLVGINKMQKEEGALKTSYRSFLRGKTRQEQLEWEYDTVRYVNEALANTGHHTLKKVSREELAYAFFLPRVQIEDQFRNGNTHGKPLPRADFASLLEANGFQYKAIHNEAQRLTEKNQEEYINTAYEQYKAVFQIEQTKELQASGIPPSPEPEILEPGL